MQLLVIPDDVIFKVLENEAVLLNLKTGTYFGLNETGTRIWKLIEEHGHLEIVRRHMLDEFEVLEEALEGDMQALLSELLERGLLVLEPCER
jgi:hypothetical protein